MSNEQKPLRWDIAKAHLDMTIENYESLRGSPHVNVDFALQYVLIPRAERYDAGERTEELFRAMMESE